MQTAQIVFLLTILISTVGCTITNNRSDDWHEKYPPGFKAEGALITDESDRPYYADYWHRELTTKPHPEISVILADQFYDSLPYDKRPPHRDKIRFNFVCGFFHGFTNPSGSLTSNALGTSEGFKSAQLYRRENPDQITCIFRSFAYEYMEVAGTWSTSFEYSGFIPSEMPEEKWWLESAGYMNDDLFEVNDLKSDTYSVIIKGYLSPRGSFGHLGLFNRELLALIIISRKDNK